MRDETLKHFKEVVEALEFRAHVSAYCNCARTAYETDRDTIKKVFETYYLVSEKARTNSKPGEYLREWSPQRLVDRALETPAKEAV